MTLAAVLTRWGTPISEFCPIREKHSNPGCIGRYPRMAGSHYNARLSPDLADGLTLEEPPPDSISMHRMLWYLGENPEEI